MLLILGGVFYMPVLSQPRMPNLLVFYVMGALLFIPGITVMILASRQLFVQARIRGGHRLEATPEKLATTGLYGMVRHPIYFGCILALIGWCLLWRSFYSLGFLVPLSIILLSLKAYALPDKTTQSMEEKDLKGEGFF